MRNYDEREHVPAETCRQTLNYTLLGGTRAKASITTKYHEDAFEEFPFVILCVLGD